VTVSAHAHFAQYKFDQKQPGTKPTGKTQRKPVFKFQSIAIANFSSSYINFY